MVSMVALEVSFPGSAIFQRACDQKSPVRFYYTAWLIGIHIICMMTFFKVPI